MTNEDIYKARTVIARAFLIPVDFVIPSVHNVHLIGLIRCIIRAC